MSAVSDQAYSEVQSLSTTIDSGDALLADKKFENAVQAYQSAGAVGEGIRNLFTANAQADAIDALNQQLQALRWQFASKATADQAQSLAKQILAGSRAMYNAATPVPSPTAMVKASPAAPSSSSPTSLLLWGTVIAGIGALGYFMFAPMKNPAPGLGGRRSHRGKRLINKGRSCIFELTDGRDVKCGGGMMHDPSGQAWPARSVLCGPFRPNVRRAEPGEETGASRAYLGAGHDTKIGIANTPPKAMGGWTYVGDVERILYTRTGSRRPGRYQHPFNEGLAAMIHGKGRVRLYRRGRYYRLQLPRNAVLDERGYVWP